jgi:hypothetical protein
LTLTCKIDFKTYLTPIAKIAQILVAGNFMRNCRSLPSPDKTYNEFIASFHKSGILRSVNFKRTFWCILRPNTYEMFLRISALASKKSSNKKLYYMIMLVSQEWNWKKILDMILWYQMMHGSYKPYGTVRLSLGPLHTASIWRLRWRF